MDSRKIPVHNYFKTMTTKKSQNEESWHIFAYVYNFDTQKNMHKIEEGLIGSTLLKLPFVKRKYEPLIYFTRRIFAKYDGPKFALEEGNTTWPYLSKKTKEIHVCDE